jgi:2-iminobutanoate/2-iminopropanoate deaminase
VVQRINLPSDGDADFPYSQAVEDEGLLFISGQMAADSPSWTGEAGDIESETREAMNRVGALLAAAGLSFDSALKVNIFMTDMSQGARMDAVFRTFFPQGLPARTTVGVVALFNGGNIEIECVARRPSGPDSARERVPRGRGRQ